VLRLAFWALLFLNAALFAYGQGYLGAGSGNEHEPARLKRQFNTPRLTLLNAEQAAAAARASPPPAGGDEAGAPAQAASSAPAATPAPAPAPAPTSAPEPKALACLDVGSFGGSDARRFEARLATLGLSDRIPAGRQAVQSQDVSSWLVHIPPQPSKEAAERKAAELRNLGVTNFFIMQGESPMKYAISLGVFKTETGAQTLLAQLGKQGVHSARIAPRGPQATRYTYRLRNLDEAARKRVVAYAERFEDVDVKNCGT
jgi:cell division septation protein DedD